MYRISTFNSERGSTLLEVLIALGAAIIILMAIVEIVIHSLNNSQYNINQYLASQYAQQGIEIVRRIRDAGWGEFLSLDNISYCLTKGSSTLTKKIGTCGQNVDHFVREVTIEHSSAQCSGTSRVTAVVSWADGKCRDAANPYCHKTELISCLSDYNFVPTP